MEETNYDIDFVKRTKKIIDEYMGEYELTLLLNCMMGLIVLPNERSENIPTESLNKKIEDTSIYKDLNIKIFSPIDRKDKETGELIYYPKTVKVFLKKMRNGVSHQNIEAINGNGSFVGVIIRNKFGFIVDFEVEFRREELQKFAIFIADLYLRQVK